MALSNANVNEVQMDEVQMDEVQMDEVQMDEVKIGEVKIGEMQIGQVKMGQASANDASSEQARPETIWSLRLFISGEQPGSPALERKIENLLHSHLNGCCRLETIDIAEQPEAVAEHDVLSVPMLTLLEPHPRVTLCGNLWDAECVLAALRIPPVSMAATSTAAA